MAFTLPALVLGACGGSDDAEGRLPDIEVETLRGGETFRLDELEGPAVVNLWATWCAPCKRELPEFEAVHRSVAGEVTFVGVNIGDDGDEAADYLDDLGITYDQYLDVDSELTASAEDGDVADDPDHRRRRTDHTAPHRPPRPERAHRGDRAAGARIDLNRPAIATAAATTPTVNAATVTARSSQ